jgi:hypothetical protein
MALQQQVDCSCEAQHAENEEEDQMHDADVEL